MYFLNIPNLIKIRKLGAKKQEIRFMNNAKEMKDKNFIDKIKLYNGDCFVKLSKNKINTQVISLYEQTEFHDYKLTPPKVKHYVK